MVVVPGGNPKECFSVVAYNILAKSLGTNMIPWVMNVSPSIRSRIEASTSLSFIEWVDGTLKPEYLRHFHKNFDSGNYAKMREFWGAAMCDKQEDIPKELTGISWHEQDLVAYSQPTQTQQQGTEKVIATTLKGVARRSLPDDVFQDFCSEVISKEENIYAWEQRGPRIFRTLTGPQKDNKLPDIICLSEYDCHNVLANYRPTVESPETFADAMAGLGYDGVFLRDPLLGREPPSGLGMFWKRRVFSIDTSASVGGDDGGNMRLDLDCKEEACEGNVVNQDLNEEWHPRKKKIKSIPDPAEQCQPQQQAVLMKAADRRNAGLVRLRHKPTNRTLAVCTAHLMTTSRDSAKTNLYPGEVRAGELVEIKKMLTERSKPDDAVLFMGDFNTNACVCETVFGGRIPKAADEDVHPYHHQDDGKAKLADFLEFDTGFDPDTKLFVWNSPKHELVLTDAFADLHQWGNGVGEGKHCTSRNAVRIEWIDYIFHSKKSLRLVNRSDCLTPLGMIPDEKNPSDHLPLYATFTFIGSENEGI